MSKFHPGDIRWLGELLDRLEEVGMAPDCVVTSDIYDGQVKLIYNFSDE